MTAAFLLAVRRAQLPDAGAVDSDLVAGSRWQ